MNIGEKFMSKLKDDDFSDLLCRKRVSRAQENPVVFLASKSPKQKVAFKPW